MYLSKRQFVCAVVAFAFMAGIAHGQEGPRVPLLELNIDPSTLYVPQPCPTTDTVTVQFRNNSLSQEIDVDWSSAYINHPPECVADYSPKSGTVLDIPTQGVKEVEITLSFIGDCDGTTTIDFTGAIQGTPGDNDTKTLTVKCNEKSVPTVSEWGLIVLTLLLLTGGAMVLRRRRVAAA